MTLKLLISLLQKSGNGTANHSADDPNTPLSPVAVPAQKQLKYSAGIVNSPSKGIAAIKKEQLKVSTSIILYLIIIVAICLYLIPSLTIFNADGSYCTVVCGEESFNSRAIRKALEVEKEPSPVAAAVQVEVAEAMEVV